ncbi:unnamed protein product [Orchesella dallaii]|uniref:Myotubularin phosphatase domain-containing protein n=1 Tax=Orchesella dallaii TaxID=48710 RepID=A0ABP1S602_9HEXA
MEFIELIKAPTVDNVVMRRALFKPIEGTLCITGHHLILSSRKEDSEELWLLHKNIDVVERKLSTFGGGTVAIKCKDFAVINLDINATDDFTNVADSIEALANIDVPSLSYPFFYRPMYTIVEDGWTAFSTEAEFSQLVLKSEDWRISQVNKDYAVCKSYPATVVVPKSISDEDIVVASSFRQGGRFPILCYRHENGTVLLRSGQPLVGPAGRRCKEDERLINAVLGPGKRGYIIDTRTQTLAQTAKSKGGGFELEVYYPQWRRVHKPIDRHHNLLDSLSKLMEACNDTSCTMDKWLSRLESSGWLTNVASVLNCAALIAQSLVQENTSVLVHGSDGTDTTLAVTALTQIILNPDCRSIRGFEALIEREFLQGGYPFGTRHFKSCYAYANSSARNPKKTYAPTFLLFVDCVWQLFTQFPCSFEFTENFLITLVQHSYASQFGTFLCDSVCEREELDLKNKTVSLWSHVNRPEVLTSYMNPVYEPNSKVIWPSVAPVSLTLWSGMFLRWVVDQSPTKDTWSTITELKEKEREMKREAIKLRKQLLDMEKAIIAKRASESTTTTTASS